MIAVLALITGTVLVNMAPHNPYSAAALAVWRQGHFLNFNGLTRLVASLWPFLTLPFLLLTLNAAWKMDTAGNKVAKQEIAMIKVVAPNMACQVIDWAMQVHGGAGVCDDFPLADAYANSRTLRFADGPDEVHKMSVARRILAKYK